MFGELHEVEIQLSSMMDDKAWLECPKQDYVGVYDATHWTELANFRSQTLDAATILCCQETG